MRKAQGNNEREEKMGREGGKGKSKDSSVGQRQTATRQHDSRWLARHCFLLGSLFLFLLILPSSSSSSFLAARAREVRTVGFIVFELDASLFCFVSRAIRGANCRSYAIAFCFLLLPPFLHDPLLALLLCCVPTLRSPLPSPTTTSLFFCSMHPDRHHRPRRRPRRKAESYSLHSLACAAPLLSNIAVPMLASSSHPTSSEATQENLSFRPLSFPRWEKRSVFVSRPPLHLSRSRPNRARLVLSILSSAMPGPHGRKREKEDKAVTEKRVKGGTF